MSPDEALAAILARHCPRPGADGAPDLDGLCSDCDWPHPCPTRLDALQGLGLDPKETAR